MAYGRRRRRTGYAVSLSWRQPALAAREKEPPHTCYEKTNRKTEQNDSDWLSQTLTVLGNVGPILPSTAPNPKGTTRFTSGRASCR